MPIVEKDEKKAGDLAITGLV